MSSTVRWDMARATLIGSAKQTLATPSTVAFDFGTPNDLNLAALAGYKPGDRILVVLTASTAGTTSTATWVIQDADDSSGSIGTPATAVTSAITGALAAGTGDDFSVFAVKFQPGRPWLRVSLTHATATDSFVCSCVVLGIPSNL